VRKEIVKWEDFEGPRDRPESAHAIRERVRRRLELSVTEKTAGRATNEAERPTRRTSNQLAGAIATLARELCHQSGVFPPVEIFHSVANYKSIVTIRTGPSPNHELHGVLEFQFILHPLDAQATQIRLNAAAKLGAYPGKVAEGIDRTLCRRNFCC
jgi:hypothetical protein